MVRNRCCGQLDGEWWPLSFLLRRCFLAFSRLRGSTPVQDEWALFYTREHAIRRSRHILRSRRVSTLSFRFYAVYALRVQLRPIHRQSYRRDFSHPKLPNGPGCDSSDDEATPCSCHYHPMTIESFGTTPVLPSMCGVKRSRRLLTSKLIISRNVCLHSAKDVASAPPGRRRRCRRHRLCTEDDPLARAQRLRFR